MQEIRIETRPAFTVAAIPHRGAYQEISPTFVELFRVAGEKGLYGRIGDSLGIYYDDPSTTPEEDLRAHVGFELTEGEVPEGMERVDVPEMEVAVVTVKGPYTQLHEAWSLTYAELLPGTGREPGDFPPYERYLNDPHDTAPEDLLTQICVPLKA